MVDGSSICSKVSFLKVDIDNGYERHSSSANRVSAREIGAFGNRRRCGKGFMATGMSRWKWMDQRCSDQWVISPQGIPYL